MNLRHTAALALVGWYLMVPPPGSDKVLGMPTRIGAPLSEWITTGEFDSADRCDAAQQDSMRKAAQLLSQHNTRDGNRLMFAQCIATDDPRLKGK